MAYVPPPPGSTTPGQPTPSDVPKQSVHIADLPPEVRKSFLLSMVFFPTLVGATICLIMFLGWWTLFKPKTAQQYANELGSVDARRRWVAARELAENIGSPRIYHSDTLTALITILQTAELDKEVDAWSPTRMIKDTDERGSRIRWWAAPMVGHFAAVLPDQADKDRGLNALLKALEEKDIAVFAARGLGLLKDPRAKDALIDALNNKDNAVRAAAAHALGAIGAHLLANKAEAAQVEPFREPLLKAFQTNQDDSVLDNITIALARLKDPSSRERLQKMLQHEDAVIRDHARRAMEILDGKPAEIPGQELSAK